ncbi:hypothetical protein BC941DRAFT_436356 [Chlamydoabsidia padenii]|nr:hypothetical protein BC941DRAFT_436356 [Chlamydoabsidia padenii]
MPPTPPMPTLATECTNETSAIDAARHVIRSASRKSKTRSTLIGDDALLKMFNRNDMMPDLDERHSDSNHHSAYTAMSGFTTVSGRSTKPGGASTRYLTNDILVRRASTLGRSHQNSQQQQQQQQQRKKSRLNGLFDTPSNDIMVPANEKVEVTQVFDLAEKQGTTLDMRKDNSANYSPPHNTLLHQPALSTINTEQRGSNDLEDSKLVQDRMNSFEGGNCRKSNGSVATMVRISQQHSQTWSGRTPPKRSSIPQQQTTDEQRMVDNLSPISEKSGQTSTTPFSTIGRSKQQRLSGWYEDTYQNKTPAEMERDHYLKTLYGTENDNLSGQR